MRPFTAMLWAKGRIVRHTVASVRNESRLKVGVVSVSAALLWLGAFVAFYEGLSWLQRLGIDNTGRGISIGELLMGSLLSMLALALFFMLMFSNVLISYSTLYRAREVVYLLQSPVTIRSYFLARFIECIHLSSWASAYLGSPLILAYGLVTGASPMLYVAALAMFVPFVTIPAALGSMITIVLARVFPRLKRGAVIGVAVFAVGLLFLFLRAKFSAVKLSQDAFLSFVFESTGRTQSPLLPSHWAAHGMLTAASGRYGASLFDFLLLLANALLLTWLAAEAAQRLFYPGWTYLMGQDRQRLKPLGKGILGRLDNLLRPLRNPTRSLVVKDIKLFWRDPTQWSQFVIFFGIMALYIANLRNRSMALQTDQYRDFIVCLNMGACALIAATLTSRFVFPLVSLEGRRFWVLGLAPITFRQIVWQKFWMSVATTSTFTLGLIVLSCWILEVEPIAFFLSVYSICAINLGLAGLSVGLGTLYPNFQEDNPARIVSGMGGTLNFLLSVAYIAVVVAAQSVIVGWDVLGAFAQPGAFPWALAGVVGLITGLGVIAVFVPMSLGLKNLRAMEF